MRAPFSFLKASGAPPFDPATLPLSGWWRADGYDGATTWSGVASAGASGGRNIAQSGACVNGSALNGHTPVDFPGGAGDYFASALAISNFIAAGAWSIWALVKMTSEPSDSGTGLAYTNAGVLADSGGYWGMFVRSTGPRVQAFNYNNGGEETVFTNGVWQLLQARYATPTIEVRVNGGSWVTGANGNPASLANILRMGVGYDVAQRVTGTHADVAVASVRHPDADFDNVRNYMNSRYGVSV